MNSLSTDFFIHMIEFVSENNRNLSFSDDAKDVLNFTKLTKNQIISIIEKRSNGGSIQECCELLGGVEEFNPAFLSACTIQEFSFNDAKIGIIANFIEMMGNKALHDTDYISLIIIAIISTIDERKKQIIYSNSA